MVIKLFTGYRYLQDVRKDKIRMKKGIAFSTVAIVAFLGVLSLVIYSTYQLTYGKTGITIANITGEDISTAKLETTKNILTQNLLYSSQEAMMTTAANGGTIYPVTYWWCNGPNPPEPEEFAYAMSNFSLNSLNGYIDALKESEELKKQGVEVSKYDCCIIQDPGKMNCVGKDSSKCEYFRTGATGGGEIQVKEPTYTTYTGGLAGLVESNRGYWIYWNLYEAAKNNLLLNVITQSIADQCPGPEDEQTKFKAAIENSCKYYETLFDDYVKCSYEILCLDTDSMSCLEEPCDRPPPDPLCYETSFDGKSPTFEPKNKVSFQVGGGSFRVKYTFTDYKYNIPTEWGLVPLKFNMWIATSVGDIECVPVDLETSWNLKT